MEMFRSAFQYIRRNLVTLALMEVLFLFLQSSVLKPLIQWLFTMAMQLSGVYYLTPATLPRMMTNPFTIGAILLDAFLLLSFILYRTFCLIECMRASRFNRTLPLFSTMADCLRTLRRVYRRHNWRLLAIALLFLPLTGVPLLSTRIQGIYLPDFLTYYMDSYPQVFAVLFFVCLLGFAHFRRWIYTLHFFCYSDLTAGPCTSNSAALYAARTTHVLTKLILGLAGFVAGYALVTFCLMSGFVRIANLMSVRNWLSIAVMSMISITTQLIMKLLDCAFSPTMIALLSAAFFDLVVPEESTAPERVELTAIDRRSRRMAAAVIVLTCIISCAGVVKDVRNGELFSIHLSNYPAIVAHRGDSVNATENTLEAFQSAIDNSANMIELDVQQSADGIPFVFHDSTLSRLSDVTLRVNKLNYNTLRYFPIGRNRYDSGSAVSYIPTFEEALQLCRDQIALNVEIKTNATDTDLVEQVVSLMEQYGFVEGSMITSSRYSVLEKVKQLNPNIQTGYIMSVAMGSFETMQSVDVFSIESSFVTRSLVNRIHAVGKTVAVWTVNDEDDIREMAEAGVDYVITDDVNLAKDVIFSQEFEEPWMRTCYNWLSMLTRR